jgi:SAM-dependent methyltransferase
MSPQLADYPRYALRLLEGARAKGEQALAQQRAKDLAPYLGGGPLRVLDVANGRLRPQYTILRAGGHTVSGVDLVNRRPRNRTDHAYRFARLLYTHTLGAPLAAAGPDGLACADVTQLPYAECSFDLAISAAAFEHFLDVPAVVAELARVLRPGGIIWAAVHVFTAPSGGHNLSFTDVPLRRVPPGIDPWDHLRHRRLPFSVPLNEWRPHQYVEAFGRKFEVLTHYCWMREGEHLLTPEIETELSAYSRDELTCGTFVIMARRRERRTPATVERGSR